MNIYESINAVMSEIGAIGKTSKNTTQGFMFRGIDAVMNAINPALVKNKVFIVPTILERTREERTTSKGGVLIYSICKVKYTFYAEDGSFVESVVIGEGMDNGDKATNKAMSIAFKYACFQVFCIPTEEMVDPDIESHEVAPKAKTRQNVPDEEKAQTKQQPKEPEPTKEEQAKIEAIEKQLIDEKQVVALTNACANHGVSVEKILRLYKRQSLTEINQKQFMHINSNWEAIKKA